ncbi:ATP-binding protein [Burkholderia perseverans]|uniref:ATP-binding protein n=1 Tax=Burkholderia perseverans TaxID=2615214 RepID=UPI001FEED632|nr:ATP-binding protein [Burkholderia perseverans]
MNSRTLAPSVREAEEIRGHALQSLDAARILINRSYLSELPQYRVEAFAQSGVALNRASDVRIFRVERLVQSNKQSVLESTTASYTALGAAGYAVFLFLRSNGSETELFIGTRGAPGRMLGQNAGELLRETFRGHFAGSSLLPLGARQVDALLDGMQAEGESSTASVTAVTGVPALSTDNREHFMQGLERFIDAAENRVYQALILAEPLTSGNLDLIRSGYEQVATQLSPLLKQHVTFGQQDSDSVGFSISQGLSESLGESLALTETRSTADTTGTSTSDSRGSSTGTSTQSTKGKLASFLGPVLGGVGALAGGPAGAMIGAQIGSSVAALFNEQHSEGTSHSVSESRNESHTVSTGESVSQTRSRTDTSSVTDTRSQNRTVGASRQIAIESTDKTIGQLIARIDHHLARIDEAKTYGGWNSAAYFIGDSVASSESLASVFLGLIRGSKSSHEDFALTTWRTGRKQAVVDWLSALSHPRLHPDFAQRIPVAHLTPATLVSGKEMAIQLGLPRRSTSTVAVVETQTFGRRVQRLDGTIDKAAPGRTLTLGNVRHLWENLSQTIELNLDQLSSHVFVSGSTGAGKSNTLYAILDQLRAARVPFLVIEPAKGEYKHVFGQADDVTVLGTHPVHSALLRINPFRFPEAIHVLEHVDRLVEIFNVCWPMYAAMPAVLKDAILHAYTQCGWDLSASTNRHHHSLFPTFADLLEALEQVLADSAWSQELKGNYLGSLATRIRSLTNGLNGHLFSADEIDSAVLFDSNVIVDLSRIGSAETKALIMGVLVMRLNEHRMAGGGMNHPLRHVTVLEEAHNILRRASGEGAEGGNLVGKSVEMLVNGIAEMRTYGEGFIIVDQSPHAVDIAAIRNTNTKIILRLPEETDRRLIGKSIALRDEQLDEIARLPRGVAIVYQNDWLEPVQCQVTRFAGHETPYRYRGEGEAAVTAPAFNREVLKLLLAGRVRTPVAADLALIEAGLARLPLLARCKIPLYQALAQARAGTPLALRRQEAFGQLAALVVDLFGCRRQVLDTAREVTDFAMLGERLARLIDTHAGGLQADLALSTQHCLMKDYSVQKESHRDVYAAWRTHAQQEARLES